MGLIKKILIVLAVLIVLPFVAALLVDSKFEVEREVTIQKPISQVFDYIKYLKNQENYSTWASMDPEMEKEFRGTDGSVGFVSAWKSKNPDVGAGEQEIIGIEEGKRLDFELRFMEPFESTDRAYMTTEAAGEGATKVIWGFNGSMNYPMNLMLVFMDMEGMLGKDLEIGLSNLKDLLENSPGQ